MAIPEKRYKTRCCVRREGSVFGLVSRILCRSSFATLLALAVAAQGPQPSTAQEAARTYRVVHVQDDDVLNIRTAPAGDARIVGAIPPDGRGVELTGSCRTWCPVRYNGIAGWVNGRYLRVEPAVAPFAERSAPEPAAHIPSHWRVTGIAANDVLLVRNAPTQQAPVVYVFAPRATCIVFVGGCQKPWCQVQFSSQEGQQTGWVDARFLAPAEDRCS